MKHRLSACLLLLSLWPAGIALAQAPTGPQATHWGVTGSLAPWTADDRFRVFYDARTLDLSGQEVRFGVTHGGTRRGEFALLYVSKRIDEGGTLEDLTHRTFAVGPDVRVTGLMAEQFLPFGTIAGRVQPGFVMAAGAGKVSGSAVSLPENALVDAQQVLRVFARPRRFQPLARAELAIAVSPAPGLKLRFSSGFNWPGSNRLSVTAMYFVGE